jgi:alkylation response protein AidB-like acyl-CoA dehydrogenase
VPQYTAPLRDIRFVLDELLDSSNHYARLEGCEKLEPELLEAIVGGAAKFAEEVVAPLLRVGDEQGCRFEDGQVETPEGYREAFRLYAEGDWQGLTVPAEEGGQGLPLSMGMVVSEIFGSGNWAWSMYGGLALAPVTCLLNAGSEEQKRTYLPKLLSGEWLGTMCLTEAHCGSDVGLLRTRAVRQDDGSYRISGNKIFVSGGESDLGENIIHSLLARVEGAPEGTKGISLFIVPKFLVNADGSLGERNAVRCDSIEKKMGLKSNATCVMNFEDATGFLVGQENRGLEVMFKLMNTARLGTAIQAVAHGEVAFQGALAYARERLQMRSLTGPKNPDGYADPIIVHPDIRRMLLTQKAIQEGSRAFIYWLAHLVDRSHYGVGEEPERAEDLLELLTPIAKAFCSEVGQEVTNLGVQIFGGHGYISDNGMEQLVRDGRISTVYEGTTGIQALDLIGRKVLATGGKLQRNVTALIREFCEARGGDAALGEFVAPLAEANDRWDELTASVSEKAIQNLDELGAASVDYLMFAGYVLLAWMWARMAEVAAERLADGACAPAERPFYEAKLHTARFYFARLLPRAAAHATAALAGAETVMGIDEDGFAF